MHQTLSFAAYRGGFFLELAIGTHEKSLKVILNDGRQFIFNSLYYEEDILYGELNKPKAGQKVTVKINPDSIKEIRLYNQRKSRIVSATVAVVIIGCLICLIAYSAVQMHASNDKTNSVQSRVCGR